MIHFEELGEILSLMARGRDFAEIYMERRECTYLTYDGGELDDATGGIEGGVALRIIKDDTTYFANGNETDFESIMYLTRKLISDVESSGKGTIPLLKFVPRQEISPVQINPMQVPIEKKVEILKRADSAARAYSNRIVQVTAQYIDSVKDFIVADSEGLLSHDTITIVSLAVLAVGRKDDMIRSGWETASRTSGFEIFDQIKPEDVATEAARIAVVQFEAGPAPAGTFTVVISSKAGGTMIHEACGHGLEADFIEKGLSVYSGKLGQKVAAGMITVVDDGTMPNLRGSSKFDEEGIPAQKIVLIENGILKGFLHSKKTAKKMKMLPTGNGRRESYRHLPIPRMRNTYIAPGTMDPKQIIAQVKEGIFVADMGGGEVDTISGNFVFHCSEAYMIRDGKVCEPIRDAILTGNGPEILNKIDAVGNDMGFQSGTCGKGGQSSPVTNAQPTIRVPGIVVGGSAH
ncbi:MAG: TldD/PmbA family protein [Acidobacteriota bacterium]